MPDDNKAILLAANAAVEKGDIEGFLQFCAEDIEWETVGEAVIKGKPALRQWMKQAYAQPPRFSVTDLVAENDMVVALGSITSQDNAGRDVLNFYSDVWRFRDGKMVALRAFVVSSTKPA